jgi:hypothetical protein
MPVSRFGILSSLPIEEYGWTVGKAFNGDLQNGTATLPVTLQHLHHKNSALPTMSHVMILYYSSSMIKVISYFFCFVFVMF